MPALIHPNLPLNYAWPLGESGWNTGMDDNLRMLGTLHSLAVISRVLTTPPASPANGDRYIVPAGATGDWAGQTDKIAARIAGAWVFYAPVQGLLAWITIESKLSVWTGSAWSAGATI